MNPIEEKLTIINYKKHNKITNYENVDYFLNTYKKGNDLIQTLRKDLIRIVSDIQYIKESNNQNEQWAIDFADALNNLSISV